MDFRTPLQLFIANRRTQWPSHAEYKTYHDRLAAVPPSDHCPEIAFAICLQPYAHIIPVNPPPTFALSPKDQAEQLAKAWSDDELKKQVVVAFKKLSERKKHQQEMNELKTRFTKAWQNEAEQERMIKQGTVEKLKGWTPDPLLENKDLPKWILFTTSLMTQIGKDLINEAPVHVKRVIDDIGQILVNCSAIDTFGGDVELISKFLGSLQHAAASNKGPMTLDDVRSIRGSQASAIVKEMLRNDPNFIQNMGRLVGNPERRKSIFDLFSIPPAILDKIEKLEAAKRRGDDISELVMEELKSDTDGMYDLNGIEVKSFVQAFEEKKRSETKTDMPMPKMLPKVVPEATEVVRPQQQQPQQQQPPTKPGATTTSTETTTAAVVEATVTKPTAATTTTATTTEVTLQPMPTVPAAEPPKISHENLWKLPPK